MQHNNIPPPYLIFLGDCHDQLAAKTADGIAYWRKDWCLGQLRLPGCKANINLPDMNVLEAKKNGAKCMIIGVVNAGGTISETWQNTIIQALENGMDVASGLHTRLESFPMVRDAAKTNCRSLINVRHPTQQLTTGSGAKRSGKRLLTVGTDCSVGKMYTVLAMEKDMRSRGIKADFRATGQTGIFIAGSGISIDAVVADFISGAVEWLTPEADPDHWDLIEGQGSLFHASYAGVSMGLIHGSQPDAIVLCHEPTRTHMRGLLHAPLPSINTCIEANINAALLTNPNVQIIGISVNTSAMPDDEVGTYLSSLEETTGLVCVDPLSNGVSRLVDMLP